jgi:hypothetical protein
MATDRAKKKVDPSIVDLDALFAAAFGRFRRVQAYILFALRNKFNDSATIPNRRQ